MKKDKEKGMVLVMVVIFGAIAIMLGTALLTTSLIEVKHGNYYENDAQAYFIARSGVEIVGKAIIDGGITVDSDNATSQIFTGTIEGDTYNVDVNRDSSDSEKIVVHSLGTVEGVDDEVTLNIRETTDSTNETIKKFLLEKHQIKLLQNKPP